MGTIATMNTTHDISSTPVRSSQSSRIAAWATPPVLAVVVLLHRTDPTDAMELVGHTTTWIWIHVALLGALVLLAHTVRHLLVGVPGRAAALARWMLPVALVTYAAFDSLVGLGTGVLVERADRLGPDAATLVEQWWSVPWPVTAISAVAQATWVLVLGATAVARTSADAPRGLIPVLVALAATFPLLHVRPIGLVPAGLLAVALWLTEQQRREGATTR
jgi:hypothetical protein